MVVKRKVFSRSSLDTFCIQEKLYPLVLATPGRLLHDQSKTTDRSFLPFGYEARADTDHVRTHTPFRCYPFVYVVNHDNLLDHLNCLEWGFLESDEAMWLSKTTNPDQEIGIMIFDTVPGCEEAVQHINKAFTNREIYKLLNIQLAAMHQGETEFLYHQLMTSPNMVRNIFMYTSYTVLYNTDHTLIHQSSTVKKRDPWSYLKKEETEDYLRMIRRHVTSDYCL